MSLSIHTNFASLVTQNTLNKNNNMLSTTMERLGTGLRINSAADDAAGLQIANRLEAQTRGMQVAQRNSQDAISMLQTADGALDEISQIAFRMKDLALQSANGTNSANDVSALNSEFQELKKELGRIMDDTTYGGQNLFDTLGVASGVSFQIGVSAAETLNVDAQANISGIEGDVSGLGTLDGTTTELANVDALLTSVGTARAQFGA